MRNLIQKLKWAAQQRPSGVGRTLLFFATVVFSLTWLYHHSIATFAGVIIVGLACGLWALFFEPSRLIRTHFIHTVQELQPNQSIRLAVLGDLHVGALHFGETELQQLITRIQQEDVQAVLLLGDYVIQRMPGGRPVAIERTAELLAELGDPSWPSSATTTYGKVGPISKTRSSMLALWCPTTSTMLRLRDVDCVSSDWMMKVQENPILKSRFRPLPPPAQSLYWPTIRPPLSEHCRTPVHYCCRGTHTGDRYESLAWAPS